ncbi:hypothetical protein HMPREF1548_04045 [Clostridium sp. KLE 1755]|nr:hypothetical protein HMPREF1548_04045 [Clostridium sp. KLE 1755]
MTDFYHLFVLLLFLDAGGVDPWCFPAGLRFRGGVSGGFGPACWIWLGWRGVFPDPVMPGIAMSLGQKLCHLHGIEGSGKTPAAPAGSSMPGQSPRKRLHGNAAPQESTTAAARQL